MPTDGKSDTRALLWFSATLIALVSNLDNLAVGVAFGARGTRIPATSNLIIAAVTMAGTASSIASGRALSQLIPDSSASAFGSLIIIVIGATTVLASVSTFRAPTGNPPPGLAQLPSGQHNQTITSHRQALVLGAALSLNNVGAGVGAGIAGISPVTTTVLAGAISFLCVGGGALVGRSLAQALLGQHAPLIGGLALISVGALMLPGLR